MKYLQNNQEFFEKDLEELLLLYGIKKHYMIRTYLCEYGKKYEELYKVKLDEFKNKNPILTKEQNLKQFFSWINDTLDLTKKMKKSNIKNSFYYDNFKQFIKSRILELSEISIEYTYNIIDKWFHKNDAQICFSLDSDELKYAYLNKYVFLISQQEEKDKRFESFLRMKIEHLIKNNYKEQIIKIITKNKILWSVEVLNLLIKNEVYDAAIFISQKRDNIENCIKLSDAQIEKNFKDIIQSLLEYSESVNSDIIYIKLEEIKRYLDLALTSCVSWTEINKCFEIDDVNNTWLTSLKLFYNIKKDLIKNNENNRLGLKYKSKTFEEIFEKIMHFVKENIEYILHKMNDYIPVTLTFKVICKEFKDSKFKEYSRFFQEMFGNTRRTEEFFNSILNVMFNSLKSAKKMLLDEIKRGSYSDFNECNYCHEPIFENEIINVIIIFKCGHVYHNYCSPIEKGKYACYVCRMKEMKKSSYIDVPDLRFIEKEKVIRNEIKESKIKIGEKKEKEFKKQNLLGKLKKIKVKKIDKIEKFQTNMGNTKFNYKY